MAGTVRNIGVNVKLGGATEFKSKLDLIKMGFEQVMKIMNQCVDSSVEYESALAGLQKTASLSDTALANMSNKIMDMSERIPKTSTEIAELADEFAHLGLSSEQILPFTEVMIKLGDTTDMSASEAGTALAQLMNVMGTATADYENLASTILYLGMSSATTESKITEMGQAMAGSGKMFGMDESDVLGLAAAMSSVGIEAEAGATGIQKLGNRIELMIYGNNTVKLKQFADVAGMTAESFSEMWKNDPSGAINAFVTGLGQISEQGGSAAATLNDLGITGVREQKVISQIAASGDLLARSLDNADRAWAENSTLAEATGIIYETTASQMSMADNAIENATIAVGDGLKGIKLDFKLAAADVAKSTRELIASDSLKEQMDTITASYGDQFGKIERARTQIGYLVDTLEEMGSVDTMNAGEQQKYNATIQALAEILPGVTSIYNEQTGAIEGGTEALRKMADAQLEAAEAQAQTEMDAEKLEAYNIALENHAELQEQAALAAGEAAAMEKELEQYSAKAREADPNWDNVSGMDAEYQSLARATGEAVAQAEDLNAAVIESEEYLSQYSGTVEDTVNSTNRLNEANANLQEINGEASDSETELITKVQAMADALNEAYVAYEEYRAAVSETIAGQVEGLGEFNYDPSTTFDDLETNMQKRLQFLTEYQQNLQKAQEMGYSTEFLSQFTDGTTESAETLAGLVTASDEQVTKMNSNYTTLKTESENLATSLATAATGVDTTAAEITAAVDGLTTGTDVDLSASGAATVQSLIDGMNSKLGALTSVVARIKALSNLNTKSSGFTNVMGFAQGLAYVPYDDYPALLHRGEMVLTSAEAAAYRAEQFMTKGTAAIQSAQSAAYAGNNYSTSNTQNVSFGTVVIREDADIDKIAKKIAQLNKQNAYGRGVRA